MKVTMQAKDGAQEKGRRPRVFTPTREVFSMSGTIIDQNLQLVCQELVKSGWLDRNTSVKDFLRLFQNHNSGVQILWTGKVGIGSLRALFQMMLDGGYISCGKSSLNAILRSHFVTVDLKTGALRPIGDLRGASYTKRSDHVIKSCRNLLEVDITGIRLYDFED